jgi:hypothetical protein
MFPIFCLNRRLLFGVLILLAISLTAQLHNSALAADVSPLPPDPEDWICKAPTLTPADIDRFCTQASRGLPSPVLLRVPPPETDLFRKNLFDLAYRNFLRGRKYATELGWISDQTWRMTGPYVGEIGKGQSYGVHPAVRIYYSPEMVDWLCGDRAGAIPDGAMLIKEMHPIDSTLDITLDADQCMQINADVLPTSWTIMIKASKASQDGWYWANYTATPSPPLTEQQKGNPPIFDRSAITTFDFYLNNGGSIPPKKPNPNWYPTGYLFTGNPPKKLPDVVFPFSEYGNYCLNCHASAGTGLTFSSLENILGPGIQYKQFEPDEPLAPSLAELGLINLPDGPSLAALLHPDVGGLSEVAGTAASMPIFPPALPQPSRRFLNFYDQLAPVSFEEAWRQRLPAETYDHLLATAKGPPQFLTSDQCIGCHDSTFSNASTPNMVFKQQPAGGSASLINLSPYGEWRASPMGLAGRDPIFFAQLQSETNTFPAKAVCMENTCLHCHGVMGQRQLAIDTPGQDTLNCKANFGIEPPAGVPFGKAFTRDIVNQWPGAPDNARQQYGALARDGISCTVCHHVAATDLGEEPSYTGNFVTGPANELYGPYEDATIVPKPMHQAIGVTPLLAEQIKGSDLCASCHNILLPVLDNDGNRLRFSYEQTTSLEWGNSDFAPGRDDFKSCQDCHMPTQFQGHELSFQIANIESSAFAPTTNRLPNADITLTQRDHYPRHALHGLNVFLNAMFQQFPLILGARQIDYMTDLSTVPPLITGRNSMLEMAKSETAAVDIQVLQKTHDGQLRAVILVTNKAGHYLPSGVGFRRIFLEFLVRDAAGRLLWASGRTNELGAILDGTTNRVLSSEEPDKHPGNPFQPHYQVIQRGDQVQIYQELIKDSAGNLTTSFVRRVEEVKDNRIRPKGFDPKVFARSSSPFIRALAHLPGEESKDPYYFDPKLTGADQIEYLIPLDKKTLARVASVQVSLYSQSVPPFYLQDRFEDANRGPRKKDDIQRLYHITSHLDVNGVRDDQGQHVLQGWKLLIATPQTATVK